MIGEVCGQRNGGACPLNRGVSPECRSHRAGPLHTPEGPRRLEAGYFFADPGGKSLSSFAEHATTKLSFPVSKTHISTRLEAFEIPINRPAPQVRKKRSSVDTAMLLAHETRINELEERINKMKAWINLTFPTYGGKALK